MPQMAPLNWLILMITFIMMFLLFNITNYYSFYYNIKTKSENKLKKNTLNWKW